MDVFTPSGAEKPTIIAALISGATTTRAMSADISAPACLGAALSLEHTIFY